MTAHRPRRSILYMPASNPRALEKGKGLDADGLILDLEDAVAPDKKDEARATLVEALKDKAAYGSRELLARVNALSTEWGADDLAALARASANGAGPDGIVLAKVNGADDARDAIARLAAAGAPSDLAIWCMIETPLAVLNAEEIAFAAPSMTGFVMGTSDLGKELGCASGGDRAPFLASLSLALLAARAAGIAIVDGVFLDLEDADGFERECRQGRRMGMDGKTLIHPKQLAVANEVFAPSAEDVESAKRIIAAHERALEEGAGVVLLDGKLVENLHVDAARRLLDRHAAIEARR